ncbi:MAG: helix-turn-helix transcriptional regulator [Peptococcaceae bacterium]|nr:helix-turn-helix transcriptional regulator [Peptococcaceae bacterium]
MKQNIPDNFISYIKYYMGKTGISTRELSKKVNKSTNYISSVLTGKIRTIEFKTALAIVETLNPKINAVQLLIDDFNIEPEEFIKKRWKEMEEEQERKLEEIQYVEGIADSIRQNLIEDMLRNGTPEKAQIIEQLSKHDFHDNIFYMIEILTYLQEKHSDKYNLIFLFADELFERAGGRWGEFNPLDENDKAILVKIRKFLEEEFGNGTTEEKEEIQSTNNRNEED